MSVRIVQLLCPQRHCVLAVAYDTEHTTKEEAIEAIEHGRKAMKIDPWCGLCASRELTFDDQPTVFKTMETAMPSLMAEQIKNLATRAAILEHRKQTN